MIPTNSGQDEAIQFAIVSFSILLVLCITRRIRAYISARSIRRKNARDPR